MSKRINVKPRKTPRQERANQMNEFILDAAARVLRKHGAIGFTTNRVAERAGVSIGSLYQYYPNKQAMLYQLHERETLATRQELEAILANDRLSARERVFCAVQHFFVTEAAEVEMRSLLKQSAIFFQESKEFRMQEAALLQKVREFLTSALPPSPDLDFQTELITTLISSVAESVTNRQPEPQKLQHWANVISEMLCQYLQLQ